jgi:hypothetical protein
MNRKEALDALSITPGWHMATAGQGQNACVEINLAVPGVVGVRDALHSSGHGRKCRATWRISARRCPVVRGSPGARCPYARRGPGEPSPCS